MQFGFNSGTAFMIGSAANPTPDQIGILQSTNLEIKFSNEKLSGQGIYPKLMRKARIMYLRMCLKAVLQKAKNPRIMAASFKQNQRQPCRPP